MFQHLLIERKGPVEYVTLNRPEVRNAFNDRVIDELTGWAADAAADSTLRVAVLAGAGRVFCAGADLTWMSKMIDYGKEENLRDAAAMATMFRTLNALPVPLIGRTQGAALGGGAGLAAVCDIVVADSGTVFGFTEVKLGILPAVIAPFALAKIGISAARELFLTGERFGADRAVQIGLAHRVVEAADLDRTVNQYVQELLSSGPRAITAAKELISKIAGRDPASLSELTSQTIARHRVSEEGQEGMRAFLDKRKPDWALPPE
jgi:methylglutaconyl-CoA hydratase